MSVRDKCDILQFPMALERHQVLQVRCVFMPVRRWWQGSGAGGNSERATRSGSARAVGSRLSGEVGGRVLEGPGVPSRPWAIITLAPLRNSDSIHISTDRSGLSLPCGAERKVS